MILESHEQINPKRDMVLVEMIRLDEIQEGLVLERDSDATDVAIRYGKVLSIGDKVDMPEHCPGLKVDEIVIFTEFAGYYVVTKEEKLLKLIRGYDIVGKYENMEKMNKDVAPTANRLLVEEYDMNEGSDLILNTTSRDPRLADMHYGKIIGIGPSVKDEDLSVGMLVAYATYVGTQIREKESDTVKALKIIVEEDILLTITT